MTAPDVSVVIPVFNAKDYVGDAIRSVLEQTLSPERVELVVVDDGSTDGSDAVLAELSRTDSRITVLTQENSGTPGGGRNPGIAVARGTFVFFLDADDLLPPEALERMVDVAVDEESDVVLGKLGSSDGRRVPMGMFKRTVLDADLLRDRVFNTLGPTKLIRRALIERLGLRFPEDQKVGEDQPFMAAAYLNARKISILADRDYYITRHREDRGNITLTRQSAASHALTAIRLAAVIEEHTEPGALRDGLLGRPLGWSLPRALDRRWLKLPADEQVELARWIRTELSDLYTDGARAQLRADIRTKLDLLMSENLEGLSAYIEFRAQNPRIRTRWQAGRFRQQLPDSLQGLVPEGQREASPPSVTGRLEDVAVQGAAVTAAVSLTLAEFDGAPDAVLLRARKRGTDEVRDLETLDEDRAVAPGACFVRGRAEGLARGVWDVYAVLRVGSWEKEVRIGADRAGTIEPEGVSNMDGTMGEQSPTSQGPLLAYFTKGRGNLSIDSGATLHKDIALARAEGLALDENGRAVLLVRTTREPSAEDEYFGHLLGVAPSGGRHLLPAVRLGDRLVGLRLPLSPGTVGATLTVSSVLGGVPAPVPITGTSFWSARAAGFGLRQIEGGGVEVLRAPDAREEPGAARSSGGGRGRLRALASDSVQRVAASSLGGTVRDLPVLGPAARSVARRIRRTPR
ncbi:glycosyltransferase family 2 protein [Brachybacterium sp. AOP43-C2-M15]|uniref:glycosyltransferase family 2 protein n=1 Tax=Brachybacterium sp. AOP43-C2-M15 TaxID=3457661 RepID=UPI00403353F0